jgi:hypothetical protein
MEGVLAHFVAYFAVALMVPLVPLVVPFRSKKGCRDSCGGVFLGRFQSPNMNRESFCSDINFTCNVKASRPANNEIYRRMCPTSTTLQGLEATSGWAHQGHLWLFNDP